MTSFTSILEIMGTSHVTMRTWSSAVKVAVGSCLEKITDGMLGLPDNLLQSHFQGSCQD